MSLTNLYQHLNEKKFKILTISSAFLADITAVLYVYLLLLNEDRFNSTFAVSKKIIESANPKLKGMIDKNFIQELWGVLLMTTLTMLAIYIVFHIIIYFLYFKGKKFARGYLVFYAWCVGVFYTLYGLMNLSNANVLIAIPGLLMLYVALGFNQKMKAE